MTDSSAERPLVSDHSRNYRGNRFVYPVLSRRSRGLSVGINLNPDKICNFDCIYCQVDRRTEAETRFVELDPLLEELTGVLDLIVSEAIYADPKFAEVPPHLRRLNDLAFSGDGEPTTYTNFDEIIARVAEVKQARGLREAKMVLITNASMFHRPAVQAGLAVLDQNQGEIWAKLDAGTEEYFRRVDRTKIRFSQVLQNITQAAQTRPLVIQSLFMQIDGQPPSDEEIDAYCARLNEITSAGSRIQLVQLYTVARRPAESFVTPLTDEQLARINRAVAQQTGLVTATFGSGQ